MRVGAIEHDGHVVSAARSRGGGATARKPPTCCRFRDALRRDDALSEAYQAKKRAILSPGVERAGAATRAKKASSSPRSSARPPSTAGPDRCASAFRASARTASAASASRRTASRALVADGPCRSSSSAVPARASASPTPPTRGRRDASSRDAARVCACQLVVKVKELQPGEFALLAPATTVFGFAQLGSRSRAARRGARGAHRPASRYETVARPARGLPLLAPMSRIAGRLAPFARRDRAHAPTAAARACCCPASTTCRARAWSSSAPATSAREAARSRPAWARR